MLSLALLYLNGCDNTCGFSDICYKERERETRERFVKLSFDAREQKRQECVIGYTRKINETQNEQRDCSYWRCIEGKDTWKRLMKGCLSAYKEPTAEELEQLKNGKR